MYLIEKGKDKLGKADYGMLRLPEEESIFSSVSVSHTSPPQGLFLLCPLPALSVPTSGILESSQYCTTWQTAQKFMRVFLSSHFRVTKPFLLWRVSTFLVHVAPSGQIHVLLYFHCLLSICFSSHSNPDSSNLDKVDLIKQENTIPEYIFQSYLILKLCFSKNKNNVANSQPIRKNQPQMSSLLDK